MNEIQNIYVKSLACIRVKLGESECFRIDSGVRQGCIMSPWLYNLYMYGVMKEVKMGMGRIGVRLPGLSYADDLVLCCQSEEGLKEMLKVLLKCVREEV